MKIFIYEIVKYRNAFQISSKIDISLSGSNYQKRGLDTNEK